MNMLNSAQKLVLKNKDKIADTYNKNKDKIADGVNKATDVIDKKTGGKHTATLKKVDDAANKIVGKPADGDAVPGAESAAAESAAESESVAADVQPTPAEPTTPGEPTTKP